MYNDTDNKFCGLIDVINIGKKLTFYLFLTKS